MNEEIELIKEEVIELLKNKRYSNLNKYMEEISLYTQEEGVRLQVF